MKDWLQEKEFFLFDMDGTLVDLEKLNFNSFRETIRQSLDLELLKEEYLKYFSGSGSTAGFRRYLGTKGVANDDVSGFVKHYRDLKDTMLDERFDEVVTVKPGVIEFLELLQTMKKKIAVATSTGRFFASPILQRSGLEKYFEVIVTVNDVVNTKPAPDIFFEAFRRLGGTDKNKAIIFEDSPNGVASAKNTGMDYVVIYTPGENDSVVTGEQKVITSYLELL